MRYRYLAAGEKANLRLDLIGVTGIGGKHQDRSIRFPGELEYGKRSAGADQSAPFGGLASWWYADGRREQ